MVILLGIARFHGQTRSEPVTVREHAILKLDFSEVLDRVRRSTRSFRRHRFRHDDGQTRRLLCYNALRAIETAKNDPRIQGIYLRPNGGGVATYAILEELREALQDFRQGGKFIIAYNETYGQGEYYLASVADKIYLEPRRRDAVDRCFFDADVLQGSFRQARYSGRNFPSDGLQVQECRGALFPFARCRMPTASRCRCWSDSYVECDGGGRRRVARYRALRP